ncbi:hypothetical protein [Candidatus Nitrosarchaeum limnium]|uniref:Uncharacterized protein n=1 Tax=Candidatus Nitrosarchaeum limnium BG20 TaxID=859192 RepID=S2E6Q1_9ARCH|nr:hypothetical protein [Candidatus Nitrosarchaeum limnium]EPA06865.1 hypothetical protein BG20_I1440 [Candidatus Nitrosarchaeum limnium BG20]
MIQQQLFEIKKLARVYATVPQIVWDSPNQTPLELLYFNSRVFVIGESSGGWYYVITDKGNTGYVDKFFLLLDPPEPDAKLYKIQNGDTALNLAKLFYPKASQKWGQDQRFFSEVLLYVNKGDGDRTRGIIRTPETIAKAEKREGRKLDTIELWKAIEPIEGRYIWYPSEEFALQLDGMVSSGSYSYAVWQKVKNVINKVIGALLYAIGFIIGVIHGFFEAIWDDITGIVDLGKMLISIFKSLLNGNTFSEIKKIMKILTWKNISSLVEDWKDEFLSKFKEDDPPLKKGHFHGWVIGYIVALIVTTFVTGGLALVAKFGKIAKLAKILRSTSFVKKLERVVLKVKTSGKFDKITDALKSKKKKFSSEPEINPQSKLNEPITGQRMVENKNISERSTDINQRLARGNIGEKLATDFLAAEGHTILSFKPNIKGTNQGGIDIVTIKDGVVNFIDNKALTRSGNVSSVSSLTTNFQKNKDKVISELKSVLANAKSDLEKNVIQQALTAIDRGNFKKAVTNANITNDTKILSGVTEKLKNQGLDFINVFNPLIKN